MKNILVALSLFGLLGTAYADTNGAVPITDQHECSQCKMVVAKYPGPKGEIVKSNGETLVFCSVKCMTCAILGRGISDKDAKILGHNVEKIDWQHPSDDQFIDLTKAWVVVGSKMKAVMGKSVAPFETKEAAQKFADQHGGAVLQWKDIKPELLQCRPPRPGSNPL